LQILSGQDRGPNFRSGNDGHQDKSHDQKDAGSTIYLQSTTGENFLEFVVYAVEEMSTNTMIGQKSNGEFSVSNQLFAESYRTIIGNQAALRVGPGSSISDFNGIVCGEGNTIQVEADVTIAGLQLEIDGDNNAIILRKGAKLKNCRIKIRGDREAGNFRGNRNSVYIGEAGSFANTMIDCKGSDNSLQIGAKVYVLMSAELFLEGYGCSIRIGDKTSIQSAVLTCSELETSIDIGEDSMISTMVVFSTGDGHPLFKLDTFERVNLAKRIVTGKHVFFTANARLMKGAQIGDNCVVGYGTIVREPIIDESGRLVCNALIAGTPAQIRRTGVTWSRQLFYEEDGDKSYEEKYPDGCSQSWFRRGHLWLWEGDKLLSADQPREAQAAYTKGVAAYTRAIKLKSDYTYAYCELGMAHVHLAQVELYVSDREAATRQFKEAVLTFQRGLFYDPNHADSLFLLANVEKIVTWLEAAAGYQTDQIESLCAWGAAYKHLAQIELYLSRTEKGRHYLTVALLNLGQVLERSPEYAPAILERNEVVAELARIKNPSDA
jgi:acetyltransferase-like isoleucine patch superfamily enzyme